MAVARMLKARIVAPARYRDELLRQLQLLEVAEVFAESTDGDRQDVGGDGGGVGAPHPGGVVPVSGDRTARTTGSNLREGVDTALAQIDRDLALVVQARTALESVHSYQAPFSMFVGEKYHVTSDIYNRLQMDDAWRRVLTAIVEAKSGIDTGQRELAATRDLRSELAKWFACPVPIERWHDTEQTVFFACAFKDRVTAEACAAELAEHFDRVACEMWEVAATVEMKPARKPVDCGVVAHVYAHRSIADEVTSFLSTQKLEPVAFELTGTARQAHSYLELQETREATELAISQTQLQQLEQVYLTACVVLQQSLLSDRERMVAQHTLDTSERCVFVTAWVRERDRRCLEEALERADYPTALEFSTPVDGDTPPVVLENPKLLRPFEMLTRLYGLPEYGQFDPTPALAPFFALFFAICIGDVGYGLMLAVAMFCIKRFLDVAPGVREFCDLMIIGGLCAVPVGALFGSWLAIPFENLPRMLQVIRVLDPLNDIVVFLGLTLALGLIQVITGLIIALVLRLRAGDWKSAVAEQVSVLVLMALLAAFIIGGGRQLWLLVSGLVIAAILQGRVFEQLARLRFGKSLTALLKGIYEVYGLTSVANDILSYTRLAALGLSSALVGMVFGLLARLVWAPAIGLFNAGGAAVVGGVLVAAAAVLIFVVGHIFNVTINLLGAFVHPMRLQFVEFFQYFHESGGRAFAPLRRLRDRVVVE
ncbi:MAG: hypothetical protein LBS17_04130 [Actinomycetes bacterium]|jgi:vacuolar-type H+-ATPase subunit I/STV1|nr:hypothetical protein [Actinomycetes bacterium]